MLRINKSLCQVFKNSTRCSSAFVQRNLWTNEKVVTSPFKDIVVPGGTVNEYIWQNLDKWATKTAVVCGVTNRQYTYEQIYRQCKNFGSTLRRKFKIRDGDSVAVMLPNMPEYPTVVLGILEAGGVVTTLNPFYTAHEVHKQIQLSDAKLIIAHPDVVAIVKESFKLSKQDLPMIVVNINEGLPQGTICFEELIKDVDTSILREVKRVSSDVSFLPYSSGTTGFPKGVELTNRNVLANFAQQDTECRVYNHTTEINQDSTLALLPMFHAYGLLLIMLHKMSVGLRLVSLPKFKPETFLNALVEYRIGLLFLVPPMVLFLGSSPQVTPKHLEHLNYVLSGAAPLPHADIHNLINKVRSDTSFGQGYGLTETGPLDTISPIGYKDFKTVGYAIPNVQLKIVDDAMKNLGPNEVGELLIKGPNVMKGYKNNPEANSQVFQDGWLKSGDMAKIDENGAVTITDRLKELIKVYAFQVAPAELEGILKEHPAVQDAAVVGVPDQITGESPRAFIVLKNGVRSTGENIKDFVSSKVIPFKKIKEVTFVDDIPKSPSGKILRRILKEKYC